MKDHFTLKMIDTKFSQHLAKVPKSIKFKLPLPWESSDHNRTKFAMCLRSDLIEFIVKRINELVSEKNKIQDSKKIKKYLLSSILKWIAICTGS